MKKKFLLFVLLLLSIGLFAKSYHAEDYYCRITVMENGDMEMFEEFQYHFSGDTFEWVKREIPDKETDGIEYIEMNLGEPGLPYAIGFGNYKYDNGDLVARWDFEPAVDKSLVFRLRFRAKQVCFIEDDKMIVRWMPLPRDHDFLIEKGTVDLILPESVEYIQQIMPPRHDNVEIERKGNTIRYVFGEMAKDEVFRVGVILSADAMPILHPVWQQIKEKQAEFDNYLIWMLLLSGVFLVIMIVVLAIMSKKMSDSFTPAGLPENIYKMHPACAAFLSRGIDEETFPFAAVFFRLLKQGAVKINKIKKHKYEYELTENIPDDNIDRKFYDLLQDKLEDGKKDLKKMLSSLQKNKKEFYLFVKDIIYDMGLIDIEQEKRRNKYVIGIIIVCVALFAAFITGMIMYSKAIYQPVFLVFPLLWLLFYLIVKIVDIKVFTAEGYEYIYTWRLWKKMITKEIKHHQEALSGSDFDIIFPYAMVMGIAEQYQKIFKHSDIDLSDSMIIQAFSNEKDFYGFMAWYVATSVATGSTGAAASAGGGAGGGSASAG